MIDKIRSCVTVILTLAGCIMVSWGAYVLHPAAGFIVGGLACFVLEYLIRPDTERGDSG